MYRVTPLVAAHIDPVTELWKRRLGAPNDYIDRWLSAVLSDTPTTGYVATHTPDHPTDFDGDNTGDPGTVVGVGIGCLGDAEYVRNYLNHPVASEHTWDSPTGIVHSLAVASEHEGNGLGTRLVETELEWFTQQDCSFTIAVSWHRENNRDSRPLFQGIGFNEVYTSPDFFEEAYDEAHCVDCEDSCTCGGTVFTMPL